MAGFNIIGSAPLKGEERNGPWEGLGGKDARPPGISGDTDGEYTNRGSVENNGLIMNEISRNRLGHLGGGTSVSRGRKKKGGGMVS